MLDVAQAETRFPVDAVTDVNEFVKLVARGKNQRYAAEQLWAGREIHNFAFALRGSSKNYSGSYERSFDAFIARIRSAGFAVEETRGPRGGRLSATYRLKPL